nr:MAG TPA: RNA polymerase II-like protein [Caudoviricetes sp.]
MSKEYAVYTCRCGRIHMVDYQLIDQACEKHMDIIHICQRCGK